MSVKLGQSRNILLIQPNLLERREEKLRDSNITVSPIVEILFWLLYRIFAIFFHLSPGNPPAN